MSFWKVEYRRFLYVIIKLLPIAFNYRRDRQEIKKAEGKIIHKEKYIKHAKKAVESFISLGPAFIKLGQLLSARPDVLPQPYLDEFAKLQDEVPPAPFDKVKSIIEQDVGRIEEIFDSFDTNAISGASLGQVYRAVYHGRQVAVKVNRPGIKDQVATDMKVLKKLVPLVGRFIDPSLRFTAESIVEQFSETIIEEMNYKTEAENLSRIRMSVKSQKDVIVPQIFPEISSERVLVLEYIDGIKVTNVKELDEHGIDRKRLARRVAKLFIKMLLSEDIFHADPHPGNISITEDGKIILYDYGMTGRLDAETRIRLIRFYLALVQSDSEKVVQSMLELGILEPTANRYVIRKGIELALADMHGKKVEESEVRDLLEVANRTIYQFPFRLPKNLVLYIRMFSILEGVCITLDPDFRFVRLLRVILEEENLVDEVYREDIRTGIRRILSAFQTTIELAPMMKELIENYQMNNSHSKTSRGHFVFGMMAGLSLAGLSASIFYINTILGRLGFVASILLLTTLFFTKKI
ncbi:MAG: AarF/ABC1/UbiB kinase family protein [Conexivisphaerales archaeon]